MIQTNKRKNACAPFNKSAPEIPMHLNYGRSKPMAFEGFASVTKPYQAVLL
jgi:hypothetical protein